MGTKSARPGTHDHLDRLFVALVELRLAEKAHDDALWVDNHTDVPARCPDPLTDRAYGLLETTGRDVATDDITCPIFGDRPLGGKSRRHPVQNPVHVVINLGEAETFEPPRGSWAEVSSRVPAIHDHGATRVEPGSHLGIHLAETDVDRPRQVRLFELLVAQHVHHLGSAFNQSQDLVTIVDFYGHGELLRIAVGTKLRRACPPR
jgi:hypothetical protein